MNKSRLMSARIRYDDCWDAECEYCPKALYIARSKYQTDLLRQMANGVEFDSNALPYYALPSELRSLYSEIDWATLAWSQQRQIFIECKRCAKRWKALLAKKIIAE